MRHAIALIVGGVWLILPPVVQAIDFDYVLIAGPDTPMPGGSGSFENA